MVGAYFDSSVLVRNYCREITSPQAISLILAEALPLPFVHLQENEIRNALRLKLFRRELTPALLTGSLSLLDEDIRAGRLHRPAYDTIAVFRRAETLSQRFTTRVGARTLDILHVAAALEIGATRFISFDERQRTVARRSGLNVLPKSVPKP